MKINKREVKIFFLGMLATLLLEVAFDWNGTVGAFIRGFNDGFHGRTERTN